MEFFEGVHSSVAQALRVWFHRPIESISPTDKVTRNTRFLEPHKEDSIPRLEPDVSDQNVMGF